MNSSVFNFDVVVIGAGHAGCEAALAAARVGANTLLLTLHLDHLAQMSCNPCIGGVAKGHVVREIDALGGMMGRMADRTALQFRMLNVSKGPAVWSPRAQCDKNAYAQGMKHVCEAVPNLAVLQSDAVSFVMDNGKISAVRTQFDRCIRARAFVLCSGTFLRGKLHYGLRSFSGGRAGDFASGLSASLEADLHLKLGRLKTGTPPRLLAKSIDFSNMKRVDSDPVFEQFSFFDADTLPVRKVDSLPCYSVHSTEKTVEIVRANLDKAPLYQGMIEGIGARYCPSFEDKVIRFPHHETHLLHLEPEGEFTGEYYINGISTSLPPDVQHQLIASIPGCERAVITRYAYAIEYDFVFPDQIYRSLQVKTCENLFLAGQINGTSGYEEAAGQGLVAGLNAARVAAGKSTVEIGRDQAYIGVMIDDLVTKTIVEPYRLFTSRAEHRLHLRQDNADLRLCDFAYENHLLSEADYAAFLRYKTAYESTCENAKQTKNEHGKTFWQAVREDLGVLSEKTEKSLQHLLPENVALSEKMKKRILSQLCIESHYEAYLKREQVHIEKLKSLEQWKIPHDFPFESLKGLKNECRQKLLNVRPTTLAQAARIDGMTPSEIALLQIHLNRWHEAKPV